MIEQIEDCFSEELSDEADDDDENTKIVISEAAIMELIGKDFESEYDVIEET